MWRKLMHWCNKLFLYTQNRTLGMNVKKFKYSQILFVISHVTKHTNNHHYKCNLVQSTFNDKCLAITEWYFLSDDLNVLSSGLETMPPHLNTTIPSRPRVLHFVSDETSSPVGCWPVATPPVHLRARNAIANNCSSRKSANELFKTILDGDCHEYHKILLKMPPVTRLVFISSIVWHLISQLWYV